MREDCNKPGVSGGGASFILIHACAKIATVLGGIVMARTNFNSCMREDCNTTIVKHDGYARVLIHACARIATVFSLSFLRSTSVLIHVCARIVT